MHPNVIRAEPANCPICGMPLSKRKKGEKETLPPGVTARVTLAANRVEQAGLQTVSVRHAPLTETITTVGQIGFDERRLARISSKTRGLARVEKLLVNFTGTTVGAGEPLAELYSAELSQAVREVLVAQRRSAQPTAPGREGPDLVALAREKLGLWGITAEQVDRILATGRAEDRLPILSPIGGVVVRKNIVEGQYVSEGDPLFEIADLSRVWVQAQVFEDQLGKVSVGQEVEATVEAFPGETFKGTVAFIDPVLNPTTRTVGVRYDLENRDGRLRPGMFATVVLRTPIAEMPAFRARFARSKVGEGDPAVVFAAADQQVCPVSNAPLDSMGGAVPVSLGSSRVYICCDSCEAPLKNEPKRYLARLRRPVAEPRQEICPVTRQKLGSMGEPVPVEVDGRKVQVCCAGCIDKLKAEPARYLAALEPAPADAVLVVPESAVVDTGTRTVVYVESEPGVFEGRVVVLGPRSGDLYPVLEGLSPGEKVATSGAFLIDAETRLNPGAAALYSGSASHDH
jgi:Cu(I)/Ag(I) efflux system membrane fusion protein